MGTKRDKVYIYNCVGCNSEFETDDKWIECPKCKLKQTVCIRCGIVFEKKHRQVEHCDSCRYCFASKEELKRLLFEEHLSRQEIADRFKVSFAYVHDAVEEFFDKNDFVECLICKMNGKEFKRQKLGKHLLAEHNINSSDYEEVYGAGTSHSKRVSSEQRRSTKSNWEMGKYNKLCFVNEMNNNEKELSLLERRLVYTGANTTEVKRVWLRTKSQLRSPDFVVVDDENYLKQLEDLTWQERQNKFYDDFVEKKIEIKKVVEFCEFSWHRERFNGRTLEQYQQDLINDYKGINIDCLVIWNYEFETDKLFVQELVKCFIDNKTIEKKEIYLTDKFKIKSFFKLPLENKVLKIYKKRRLILSRQELISMILVENLTQKEIAFKNHVSLKVIKSLIKKYNLKKKSKLATHICINCYTKFLSTTNIYMCKSCQDSQKEEFKDKIEGIDFVECKICGLKRESFAKHLTNIHGISTVEYKHLFNSDTICKKVRQTLSESVKKSAYQQNPENRKKSKINRYQEINSDEQFLSEKFKNLIYTGGQKKGFESLSIHKAHRCPDFVVIKNDEYLKNLNGKQWFGKEDKIARDYKENKIDIKKVVEFCGYFWHKNNFNGRTKEQYENDMISDYKRAEIECLIIWNSEFKDITKLETKVNDFVNT